MEFFGILHCVQDDSNYKDLLQQQLQRLTATATAKTYFNSNCKDLLQQQPTKTNCNSNCKDLLQQQLQRLTSTATAKTYCNSNCKDLLQQQLHYQIGFGD